MSKKKKSLILTNVVFVVHDANKMLFDDFFELFRLTVDIYFRARPVLAQKGQARPEPVRQVRVYDPV